MMFLNWQNLYMCSFLNPSVEILYTTSWPFTHSQISKNWWGDRGSEKWIRLELLKAIHNNLILLFFLTFANKVWWQSKEKAVSVQRLKNVCSNKYYPKSLCIQDMVKLGKVISKKSYTVISIYKYDFEHMQWSNVPVEAELLVLRHYLLLVDSDELLRLLAKQRDSKRLRGSPRSISRVPWK